jgi:hypothetical protein
MHMYIYIYILYIYIYIYTYYKMMHGAYNVKLLCK